MEYLGICNNDIIFGIAVVRLSFHHFLFEFGGYSSID